MSFELSRFFGVALCAVTDLQAGKRPLEQTFSRFSYAYTISHARDAPFPMVQLALRRPYTFIVMAMLIVLATPFALLNMATDIFPEINIPVISVIWNYNGNMATDIFPEINIPVISVI